MPDIDVIQTLIQGGAVGLLLAFGFGIYKLTHQAIDVVSNMATNHLAHLTNTLNDVNSTLCRLDSSIQGCPRRGEQKKDAG